LAASLYCLDRLRNVLMPLLVAMLLAYAIMPMYSRLKKRMSKAVALAVIGVLLFLALYGMGRVIYGEAMQLNRNLPKYQARATELAVHVKRLGLDMLPRAKANPGKEASDSVTSDSADMAMRSAQTFLREVAAGFANFLMEAVVVGFYVVLLLEEGSRFPERVRTGFPQSRAARILNVAERINQAVYGYLSVKVKAALLVALPVTLALMLFGVPGAALWGVLTFFGRFVPYVGSVVTCVLPIGVAVVATDSIWKPILLTVILVVTHVVNEYAIEPAITGRALGVSPLAILLGLAFWASTWGIVGMCLAVPLTVILKIVMDNLDSARPYSRFLSQE
jgi:predicted PurR-regulated permease PerM